MRKNRISDLIALASLTPVELDLSENLLESVEVMLMA